MIRLQDKANRVGISVDVRARGSIVESLAAPDERFERFGDYVLTKNENLYRRLA